MELFYSNNVEGDRIILDEEESHHCIKVMRHIRDDELMVTDGAGKLFRTRITQADRKATMLEIIEIRKDEPASLPHKHIAISPTKNADRFEWFLEKATEIGIDEITPVICRQTERDKIKMERLNKLLISAMKQSIRLWLPRLNEVVKLTNFIDQQSSFNNDKFICHCQSEHLPALKDLYQPQMNVTILIGPEGDFTNEEINLAEENGFRPVSLGAARLRTETAGIIAVHSVQLLNS